MQKVIGLGLAAALVAGCGSAETASVSGGVAPTTGLVGRVVNEQGGGESGVQVVVHERTTNFKAQAVTGSDGGFALAVPAGVYDVGLDREGDLSTATCFSGPVSVSAVEQRDFTLRSSSGKSAQHVFGRIQATPGVPASQRRLNLRSALLLSDAPNEAQPEFQTTTTGTDGTFEMLLASDREQGLDLEVLDAAGNLDEFIDFGKLSKPTHLDFSVDLPVAVNRLRSHDSELNLRPTSLAQADTVVTVPGQLQKFTASTFNEGGDTWARLANGLIPVGPATYDAADIVTSIPDDGNDKLWGTLSNPEQDCSIRVDDNGSWFWDYAVNIFPDRTTRWRFTDLTNDTYNLWVLDSYGPHKVSYNSKRPQIQRIEFKLIQGITN